MAAFKRLPTSIRHLGAWLRVATQPTFWLPTVVFCAGGVLIWAVAVHPEWLSIEEENITDSNTTDQNAVLSAEDKIIAADIDTVPVLVDQLNRSSASTGILNNSVIRTKGLYNELRDRSVETPKPAPPSNSSFTNTPVTLPSSEIPTFPISGNNNPFNFNSAASLTPKTTGGAFAPEYSYPAPASFSSDATILNSGKSSPKPQAVSQLQTAIENYRTANSSFQKTNSETSSFKPIENLALSANPPATSPDPFPGFNPSIPTPTLAAQPTNLLPNNQAQVNPLNNPYQNNQPNNFYPTNQPNNPYQTNLESSGAVPQLQQVAPTAPSATVPGIGSLSPNNFGQSSFSSPIQGSKVIDSTTPNSGNVGFPTVPQAQPNLGVAPNQINQTFQPIAPREANSAPRPLPGRYIGGGEIDTFANP